MRLIAILAIAFFLSNCSDLPVEPSEAQQQPMQRSPYAPGSPGLTSPSTPEQQPAREPVPGEIVPNR